MKYIKFLLLLIILVLVGLSLYLYLNKTPFDVKENIIKKLTDNGTEGTKVQPFKQLLGCRDIRDILKEDGKAYLSCDGGIVIFDLEKNKVDRFITMSDGLVNRYVNNSVKYKDKLYIGTQEGITEFNLSNNKVKNIGMSEGLSNNANVELALDGDYLWAFTFNGLNRIDLKNYKIDVYTEQLSPNSSGWTVDALLPLKDYVYASVIANVNSKGSVARYDKKTGIWESFGPDSFNRKDQYARIDFFYIFNIDDFVYLFSFINRSDLSKSIEEQITKEEVWKIKNSAGAKFEKVEIEELDKITKYLDTEFENDNIDLDLPVFTRIFSVINNKAYVKAQTKDNSYSIFEVDLDTLDYKKIYPTPNSDDKSTEYYYFKPMENETKILIAGQECGMGCSDTLISVYDYLNNKADTVDTSNLRDGTKTDDFSSSVSLIKYNEEVNSFVFLKYENPLMQEVYKLSDDFTKIELANKNETTSEESLLEFNCTNFYEFDKTFKRVSKETCALFDYAKIKLSVTAGPENIEVTFNDKAYVVKMAPAPYYPFDNWVDNVQVNKIIKDSEVFWISTSRGLAYINTENGVTSLYGVEDGLITPEIQDFTIYDKKIISIYNGISVIDIE